MLLGRLNPEPEQTTQEKLQPILAAVGASVVLSVPFYYRNLQRLWIKISSGGEDSGYESVPEPKSNIFSFGKKKEPEPPKSGTPKFVKQLAMSAFKVKLD